MSQTTFFVFASLAAGGLNYLFQLVASSRLDAQGFAEFNSWLAHLHFLGLIPGLAQFYTSFFPSSGLRLRNSLLIINLLCLTLGAFALLGPDLNAWQWGLAAIALMTLVDWISGQAQNRMLFGTIGVANLMIGASKLAILFLPLPAKAAYEICVRAIFFALFPGLWLVTAMVWRHPQSVARVRETGHWLRLWTAPVAMSLASAFIPQMDTLLLVRTQSDTVFQDFSRATLFSRGVFYLFLIFAQWLLPRQIRGLEPSFLKRTSFPLLMIAGTLGSALLALTAPVLATWILNWDRVPARGMIFEACLNMAFLTSLFISVQNACAKGSSRLALLAIGALFAETALQYFFRAPIDTYFAIAIVLNLSLAYTLHRALRLKVSPA